LCDNALQFEFEYAVVCLSGTVLAVSATEPIRFSQTVHANVPQNSPKLVVLSAVLLACDLAQTTHQDESE
jgi:hypothetical protein